ncbi:MAG TPA: Na/Pi cotransporter family protein [Candidatus Faecicola pullistercoris]|nr:Na/Pi cotransporter family protein [Candidatus Faecicola pullistercoris]
MNALDIVYAFFTLFSGIGVFMFGMKLMGDSLENLAGNKIKTMFSKISDNKLMGVGIGLATTAVIQSSSAVTVMLVGLVNSGLMTLMQATTIIYGANIGTTVTAQLVAFGYGGIENLNLTAVFAACAGVGAFMVMFAKNDRVKKAGSIVTGLGMIFAGLTVMGDSMKGLSASEGIRTFISGIRFPLLLLLFGILFTGIIQSSSAVSGLVITMSVVGMLSFEQAMYIIVGSNIGTCVTALLASIGTSTNAKRVAVVHLLFNVFGVTIFMLCDLLIDYAMIFDKLFSTPQLQIAMLHTFFNVITTIILLPFTSPLVKLATLIVKDKPQKRGLQDEPHMYYIEEHILSTPPIAVAQLKKEISHMAELCKENFLLSVDAITKVDLNSRDLILKNEKIINYLNREISKFLVKLSHEDISLSDRTMIGTTYHTLTDLERIGDYAINMIEGAEKLKGDNAAFSDEALAEIGEMRQAIEKMFNLVIKAYENDDLTAMTDIDATEQSVDDLKALMRNKHIERLNKGSCSAEVGVIFLTYASNAERVADHLLNVAQAIQSYAPGAAAAQKA